ncbi:MAG: hypothetical protein GY898_26075 [Proteobacteria bacterium]|nr:hypothetical protein [Pseudomonadota bacterium]
MLRASAAVIALLLIAAVPSFATPAAPEMSVLIQRISQALGGADGGRVVLEKQGQFEFVFRRTIRDSITRKELTADHRYVFVADGQERLDIRMKKGEGTDSAVVLNGDAAWVIAEGEAHDIDPATADSRLREFAPERLFSVPLSLATDGRQILGDAALTVAGRVDESGQSRFVLVGKDSEGNETARLEVDARNYLPLEVAFQSRSGEVVYRYGDYREVADGLVVPFEREFLRNGIRVSRTEVTRLGFRAGEDLDRFDRSVVKLKALKPSK